MSFWWKHPIAQSKTWQILIRLRNSSCIFLNQSRCNRTLLSSIHVYSNTYFFSNGCCEFSCCSWIILFKLWVFLKKYFTNYKTKNKRRIFNTNIKTILTLWNTSRKNCHGISKKIPKYFSIKLRKANSTIIRTKAAKFLTPSCAALATTELFLKFEKWIQ